MGRTLAAWSSLEVAKLLVAVATPIAVVLLGIWVRRATQRLEDIQWTSRRILERRLELYDELAPILNDLFCFFCLIGDFLAITPPDALALKRQADKIFYVNKYLFDADFAEAYGKLMDIWFAMYQGVGTPARLRAPLHWHRDERKEHWTENWADMFVSDPFDVPTLHVMEEAYNELMETFAAAAGAVVVPAQQSPVPTPEAV